MLGQPLGKCDPPSPSLSTNRSDLDALMAHHDGLVHAVLRRQWGGCLDCDERLQAGRIGLWHALQGFDPSRGFTFSTYAWPAIEREIWRAVRQSRPPDPPPSADPPANLHLHLHLQAEPDEALLQAETRSALHALVRRLPAALRQVVIAYYGLGDEPPCWLRRRGGRR